MDGHAFIGEIGSYPVLWKYGVIPVTEYGELLMANSTHCSISS